MRRISFLKFPNFEKEEKELLFINQISKLKLPEIKLPKFSNADNDNLEKFWHALESIINKHSLSSYEKYVYLLGQLSGAPKVLVESLDINEQTYDVAKELLNKAFASKLSQKYDVIKRLSSIKLPIGTDPFSFIGEVRSIMNSVNNLQIDVDTIMQYFVWSAMNDQFQNQIIQICNTNRPDLTQIMDNIFEATDRYGRLNASSSKSKSQNSSENRGNENLYNSSNLAVNVDYKSNKKFKRCNLCASDENSNDNHLMKECEIYKTAREKVDKLSSINACTKCSFRNHVSSDCRFKFASPCRYCKGGHMSYLCVSASGRDGQPNVTQHRS